MALILPLNFSRDITGRDTALIPIVKIGDIYISTNSMTYDTNPVLPLLTSNPSLKESIDIATRRYKISNISIIVNNFPYENKRFSERVEGSLINTPVEVYWTSPSTTNFTGDTSALMIYRGQVRRYDQDDTSCKISIEDRSQATLHKDLPLEENYLTGDEVPDKYKNKPIPMVYGHVDRSPCVISSNSDENGESILLVDNDLSDSTLSTENETWEVNNKYNHSKLFLFNNIFADIVETTDIAMSSPSYTQWANVGNKIIFPRTGASGSLDQGSGTLTDYNKIEVHYIANPQKIKTWINPNQILYEEDIYAVLQNPENIFDSITANYVKISNVNLYSPSTGTVSTNTPYYGGLIGFEFNNHFGLEPATIIDPDDDDETLVTLKSSVLVNAQLITSIYSNPTGGNYMRWNLKLRERNDYFYLLGDGISNGMDNQKDGRYNNSSNYDIPDATDLVVNVDNSDPIIWEGLDGIIPSILWFELYMNYGLVAPADIRIASIAYFIKGEYKYNNFAALDFYANVRGRGVGYIGQGLGWHYPDASSVIQDILDEVGYAGQIDFGTLPYDWEYAFTIDSKIDSKKLIEGIASASPYIPRFDNRGNFKFDVIELVYNSSDHTIKEADVIDFSFKRSKIESVVTKVELKYNWDYARGEFSSRRALDIVDWACADGGEWESFEYYGLPEDNLESTLVIDDDRGKYIRDDDTAEKFVCWMMSWYSNQHLIMLVKLPLSVGLKISISDIVEFDVLLGGISPYGIDYKSQENGVQTFQAFFPYFMVTETNKQLDYVEISCIQMHQLWAETATTTDQDGNMSYD